MTYILTCTIYTCVDLSTKCAMCCTLVVQPPPHPVQESASRTRETAVIVAGEQVWFPVQQQLTSRTAFGDGVWHYRDADVRPDNDSCCCYLLEPREETNHCGRREEMVSSFECKVPKNCVA